MLKKTVLAFTFVVLASSGVFADHHEKLDNKTIVIRFFDALTANNFEFIEQYVALDYIDNGEPSGPVEQVKKFGEFRRAIPDIYIKVEDQVAEGDKVVSRGVWGGTLRGELMGMKGQGKTVKVNFIVIHRFEDGKLAEEWDQHDLVGLMEQLGKMPGGSR